MGSSIYFISLCYYVIIFYERVHAFLAYNVCGDVFYAVPILSNGMPLHLNISMWARVWIKMRARSILEEKEHFEDIRRKRESGKISEREYEDFTAGILNNLKKFIIFCDKELGPLVAIQEPSQLIINKIKAISDRKKQAKQALVELESLIRTHRSQKNPSYIG